MRAPYDMTHYHNTVHKMGRLQTIMRMNVVAGDSVEGQIDTFIRLNPLRRPMIMDARLDVHLFYVPHRFIYAHGVWEDWIRQGMNARAGETLKKLPTYDYEPGGVNEPGFLGWSAASSGVPIPWHVKDAYIAIWNRYYRNQLVQNAYQLGSKTSYTNKDEREFGLRCNNLKNVTSTLLPNDVNLLSDFVEETTVSGKKGITISELNIKRIVKKDRAQKDIMVRDRYDEIMQQSFGTNVSMDAVNRPMLVAKTQKWFSGKDVDGTSEENFAQSAGKATVNTTLRIPRRRFNEHGSLVAVALIRMPQIRSHAIQLTDAMDQTYENISCDPKYANMPLIPFLQKYVVARRENNVLGYMPANQQHRTHENFIHNQYSEADTGYPISDSTVGSLTGTKAEKLNWLSMYDIKAAENIFRTNQLGHARSVSLNKIRIIRNVGDVNQSMGI